jgi:hypothetical protein
MSTTHVIALLLAVSVALHIGNAAAFIARRAGASPSASALVAGSAVGSACALYLAGISAYR